MNESPKKSGKRKELSLGQLKAVASEIAQVLGADADDTTTWNEFSGLPASERRKVLDLIPPGLPNVRLEKLVRLARITLSGGVANKHEAALKSVAGLSARLSLEDSRRQDYLRQLLADLINPAPLKADFALPSLGEVDPTEIAEIPGVAVALGSLFADPIPTLGLPEHVRQWARLLGAVLVASGPSRSLNPAMASAILQLCRTLPLNARPLELRLSEPALELLVSGGAAQPLGRDGLSTAPTAPSSSNAGSGTQPHPQQPPLSVSEVLDLLQRTIVISQREEDERRSALSARLASLESDIQREKLAYRDLEERYSRLRADLQHIKDGATELRSAIAAAEAGRDSAQEERDTLRRELELVGGMGTASVEAARAEVRKSFMRLTLLPLQSTRAFAQRLRANPTADNPDLLIVPLRTIIQVLHQQGFATEAEIAKL